MAVFNSVKNPLAGGFLPPSIMAAVEHCDASGVCYPIEESPIPHGEVQASRLRIRDSTANQLFVYDLPGYEIAAVSWSPGTKA
jgi:hypothetical protein